MPTFRICRLSSREADARSTMILGADHGALMPRGFVEKKIATSLAPSRVPPYQTVPSRPSGISQMDPTCTMPDPELGLMKSCAMKGVWFVAISKWGAGMKDALVKGAVENRVHAGHA